MTGVAGGGVSFFAERLAEATRPWSVTEKIEISPPDDVMVAALDECDSVLDELETLTGSLFDLVVDEIDDQGRAVDDYVGQMLTHFHLDRPPITGWHSLVEQLNVYGGGIEYDLDASGFRWGLHDYFAGAVPGGWDHLLRMISRLPMGSHYRSAIADDDALAEQIAAIHGPLHKRRKGSRPPLEEFDRTVMYLHRIDSRLGYLAWAVFAAQAGKKRGSPPKGEKGPETADERFEFRDFLTEHEQVVGQVLKSRKDRERGPKPEAVRGAVMLDHPPAIGQNDEKDEGVTDG